MTGMDEYIERKSAIMAVDVVGRRSGIAECIAEAISIIPAADVAPVRHGLWERDEWGSYLRRCSVCKKSPVYQDERGNSVAVYAGVCINCGAIMDLEK